MTQPTYFSVEISVPDDAMFSRRMALQFLVEALRQAIKDTPNVEFSVMPTCFCLDQGQPMTAVGVMHKPDCEWLKWDRNDPEWR